MAKITCYLPEDTLEEITQLGQKEKKPLSKMMRELIDIGLLVKSRSAKSDDENELTEEEKWAYVQQKMCYAQLQILEISKAILTSVFDETKLNTANAETFIKDLLPRVKISIENLLSSANQRNTD